MFAGLRTSEIMRLDWSSIDLDRGFIEVAAKKTKTAQRRLVTITENLQAWLAPFVRESGPVSPLPTTYQWHFRKAACAAGIARWPNNALRHSFASYLLADNQDAARVALQLGHSESRTLFAHYRELVKPEEAKAFWQIFFLLDVLQHLAGIGFPSLTKTQNTNHKGTNYKLRISACRLNAEPTRRSRKSANQQCLIFHAKNSAFPDCRGAQEASCHRHDPCRAALPEALTSLPRLFPLRGDPSIIGGRWGWIPYLKIGGMVRFDLAAVRAALEKRFLVHAPAPAPKPHKTAKAAAKSR